MTCFTKPDCKDERNSSCKKTSLLKYVTKPMLQQAPELVASVQAIHFDTDTLVKIILFGMQNNNDFNLMKDHFFKNYQDVWTKWNPEPVKEQLIKKYGA